MANEDEENIYNISDLFPLDGLDWIGSAELCVPQDPIEFVPSFPDFPGGLISTAELRLSEDFDFLRKSEGEKQTAPSKDCRNGITHKKPRSKRISKQRAWSVKDAMLSALENHPDMISVSGNEHFLLRKCVHCQVDKTPQWRAGPSGPKTLCNACGMRYSTGKLLPEYRPAASPTFDKIRHSNFHKQILKKRANLI
ncbi:hypothetical protein OIU76_025039 [Salix suchowensis]|nr:GATA transcription factor [Salix suchowensis]KAJ6289154.1 hypothetical protein OIU76_025039 [Salix suchowensis]KAJ6378031.1 hypothetical protein OIU78_028292 [Salix suchowensis]